MVNGSDRPKTLDGLKAAFLRNAIEADDRAFDLRETAVAPDARSTTDAAARRTNDTKPAESWA